MINNRLILILTSLILCSSLIKAQVNKNSISFNLGIQNSNLINKNFYTLFNDEGSYPTKQSSCEFIDLNIILNKTIANTKFETNFGIGFNQKGYKEIGMGSDGTANYVPYKLKITTSYFTGLFGLSYKLFSNKNVNEKIGLNLIPALNLQKNNLYRNLSLSSRINYKISIKLTNKINFTSSPYFETALTKINRTKLSSNSSNYLPYEFGINFGIELNR